MQKATTWCANYRCFMLPPMSKFLILRVWLGWCAKRTRGLYWFEQNVPTSNSLLLLVLLALKVYSRGYKRVREGPVPSLWWKELMGTESSIAARLCVRGSMLVVLISCPIVGCLAFPFIGQGKARVTAGETRRTRERESNSGSSGLSFFVCGSHWHGRW